MDAIVKFLEKHQPLFDKISRNIYLVAIKDGFLSNMPIVLFSSLLWWPAPRRAHLQCHEP